MKRLFRIKLYSCLALVLCLSLLPLRVFAVVDTAFYSANDILFPPIDPDGCSVTATYTGKTNIDSLTANDTLKAIYTQLIAGGMNGVQAAAVMGNMYGESGFNPTADEEPAGPGYGLVQWSSPGRKAGLIAYAAAQGKPKSDISAQVGYVLQEYNSSYKASLTTTDFGTGTDVSAATKSWMLIYEAPLMSPANDPAALNSKRIPAAIKIYGFYSNLSGSTSTASTTNCSTADGVVAGKVVDTALNLALSSPQANHTYTVSNEVGVASGQSDARDTYQTAKPKYNPSVAWSDCGGFIATVMIASGADTSYPPVNVTTQIAYVTSHPDKYLIIPKPTSADLQPGDILLSDQLGHTMMYTGQAKYPFVDASLTQRIPSVRTTASGTFMLGGGAIIARLIK